MNQPRRIALLGSTGSIGRNTLEVVRRLAPDLSIFALAAHSNAALLAQQCQEFQPEYAILADPVAREQVDRGAFPATTRIVGSEAVARIVQDPAVDLVVSAIVGAAGLEGTWAAVEAGKTVAIANKESLVIAGPLLAAKAQEQQARLLPVDSEHSAIAQALGSHTVADVERVVLTGSGGPFRGCSRAQLEQATVEKALRHPTWTMGAKITIDSATLMNKALEVIEARWLFGLDAEAIKVIIHPESIVHSFVEFRDGSVLAQLSPPDMKLPIQWALLYPRRVPGPASRLDWNALRQLTFEPPDREAFPALDLGYEAARRGGSLGAVLNAANETAVAAFLEGRIGFTSIAACCQAVVHHHSYDASPTLEQLLAYDAWARQEGLHWIQTNRKTTRSQ